MSIPPSDPRASPVPDEPTWRAVLASFAAMAAIPFALWAVSQPIAGTVALAGIAGLFVGTRRAYGLVRCLSDCGGFAVDLGDAIRVTVVRTPADEPNYCR